MLQVLLLVFLPFTHHKCYWDFAPSGGQLPCGATRVARHWAEVHPSLENKTKCSLSTKKDLIWNTKKQRIGLNKNADRVQTA